MESNGMTLRSRPVTDPIAYTQLRRLLSRSKGEIVHDYGPYFYEYYRKTIFENSSQIEGDILAAYRRSMVYYADLMDLDNQRVVDYGCGHGLTSLFFGMLGAKDVLGVDISAEKVRSFEKILEGVDRVTNVSSKQVSGGLDGMESESYDRVFLREVLSHASSIEEVLSESLRVLKSGGKIVVVDENNALSPKLVARVREFWEKCEKGPVDLHTGGLPAPYEEMRRVMIQREFPAIQENAALTFISRETRGLYGAQVTDTVREYLRTGRLRNAHKNESRNPLTGEYPERPINPYKLADLLRMKCFHHVFAQPELPFRANRRWIRYLISPFFPIVFRYSKKAFEITAVKR